MHYYNAKSKVIMKGPGSQDILSLLGGGKRPFLKRTCRSKSRCGGAGAHVDTFGEPDGLLGGSRGVRGVRRSRRGGDFIDFQL